MLPLGVIRRRRWPPRLRGLPNDVYFQIGFLTTLGLTTKNAILIVQFAKERLDAGNGLIEATLEAAKTAVPPDHHDLAGLRLRRPAAGHRHRRRRRGQNAIGTAVLGGMVSATFIDLIFIPLFFVLIDEDSSANASGSHNSPEHDSESAGLSGGRLI